MVKRTILSAVPFAIALVASPALAQRIATRAALDAALLPGATTETFGAIPVAAGTAISFTATVLDASTPVPGVGPGAIAAGVRFGGPDQMQISGPGYFGATSQLLNAFSTAQGNPPEARTLVVSFLNPTSAFGLDLTDFDCCMASLATATVYGIGNVLLGTFDVVPPGMPLAEFIGWRADGGIDRVELLSTGGTSWTPLIDNVTFGNVSPAVVAPEPATYALLAAGLLALGTVPRRLRRMP